MNKTMRTASAAVAATLAFGLLGACDGTADECEDDTASMSLVTGRGGSSGGGGGGGGSRGGSSVKGPNMNKGPAKAPAKSGTSGGSSSSGVKPGKVHVDIDECEDEN